MRVTEFRKGHVKAWVERHSTWQSPATQRTVLSVVLAAFNHAEQMYAVPSPLNGLKKPPLRLRLDSFSATDEAALYAATEERFRDFLDAPSTCRP